VEVSLDTLNVAELKINKHIDKFKLDEEWERQPDLVDDAGNYVTAARKERDIAKSRLELVKADLYQKITKDPAEYGLSKTTEKAIDSTIILQADYMVATKAVIETNYLLGLLESYLNSLGDKRKSMEALMKFYEFSYYAKPTGGFRTCSGANGKEEVS